MEYFKLRYDYMGGSYYEGYDVFYVQCDDMHCFTIVTSGSPCLFNWIVELFWTKQPHDDRRIRVSMDIIWDQCSDDYNPKTPVTLQFCHENCCIIYHVSPPDNFPRSTLEHFLNHDCVDFVGLGMPEKVQYLRKAYNLAVKNWFDIPFVACCLNPKSKVPYNFNVPLQNMVFKEFSKWYPKPADILQSNWRLIKLSSDKVMYAALDCYFAYKLAVRLSIPPTIELELSNHD